MSVCNHDCFNCIYSDCICNEPSDDLALDYVLDRECHINNASATIAQRKYRKTEKGKQSVYKYNHSVKHKKVMRKYNKSEKGKVRFKRFEQTEARKAYRREWQRRKYKENKLKEKMNNEQS